MTASIVDFSAQFGGEDAATEVLPHFWALKAASDGLRFEGFPFPELSYILRVDGESVQFNLSGADKPKIEGKGVCLSVDIGITREDRDRIPEVICDAIRSSVDLIKKKKRKGAERLELDSDSLEKCLSDLIVGYQQALLSGGTRGGPG